MKQAEVSLCAAVSGAAAASAPSATAAAAGAARAAGAAGAAPHNALDRELASIEAEQTERLQPTIARLEASLRLIVGPFDVAALERLVLPALRGFGGEVRAQGVPPRLGALDSGYMQLVMSFACPETKGATAEARRKWAALLLLVRRLQSDMQR